MGISIPAARVFITISGVKANGFFNKLVLGLETELSTILLSQMHAAAVINEDDYRRYQPNYRKLYAAYGSDSMAMPPLFPRR